ncbi:GNAT family N-acetyltransferase [Streptomyces sp. NPDC059740]|uniref:GNAT family N-acetyltransferase n=1 Tax=Streptomyces sp. NPDC059740 TaxID=3346926 RepID=UPI0036462C63
MTEADGGSELLSAVYEEVLRPAFPAEELESLESLRAAALAGRAVVSTVVDDEDRPQAVAVGDMDEDSGVLLLSYLAVCPGVRSSGLGGRLMREVTQA